MTDHKIYTQETKNYYNKRFGKSDFSILNGEEQSRWEIIEKTLIQFVEKYKKSTINILDFGCGDGRFSALLRKYGEVTALDFADLAIEKARERYTDITFHSGDASAKTVLKKLNKKFDVIISSEVIEHLIDQDQYLKNISSLLRADGALILTTPNKRWFQQFFEFGKKKSDQPYEFWLSTYDLREKITNLGLEVLEQKTFRSVWIFNFRTYGLLRILGNRWTRNILELLRLKLVFLMCADRFGLGIYQMIFVKKPASHG